MENFILRNFILQNSFFEIVENEEKNFIFRRTVDFKLFSQENF